MVDYPDDDDDPMDAESGEQNRQMDVSSAEPATPVSAVQTPPERLSEKRRREEEDEDELVKLTSTPKRRNSSSSSGASGFPRGKRTIAIGSNDRGATHGLGGMAANAAPKRIAINLGSNTAKPILSDTHPSSGTTDEGGEKDTREENQPGEGS